MPLLSFTSRADSNNFSSPPALPADENILSTHADIALYLNTDNSEGNGTLYCTNKQLIWLNNSKEAGYALDYPSILMHAVCRDTSTFPHACIYCQLDAGDDDEMTQQQDSDSEHSSEDSAEESESAQPEPLNTVPELRFVPADSNTLNEIYDGMCAGALLHPATEQEGEGDFFFDDVSALCICACCWLTIACKRCCLHMRVARTHAASLLLYQSCVQWWSIERSTGQLEHERHHWY